MIEKRWSVALLLTACLFPASRTNAQQPGITARMLFPPRNYEIALGDTITPTVRVWNRDTISHSGDTIYYSIANPVTGVHVYYYYIILPAIAPGDSLDTTFAPYPTNPNILRDLGTFDGCLITASNTVCSRLFGMRRTAVPFRDPSDNYGKTASGDIPDQTLWASLGTTVMDGEGSTWDPPPPRYSSPGVGPDTMLSPVLRLDRKDFNGNYYSGTGVGDTLTSFPINLQGKIHITFHFDYMRAGRHRYPLRWDDSVMIGPESTILDSAGNVLRPGDSLILEFKKPSAPEVNPSPTDWNEMAAIDGGRDFEFKTFFARPVAGGWQIRIDNDTSFLPDTSNYFTSNFRFRFRLKASDNGRRSSLPIDDADQWYIDNPTVLVPLEPDLEVRWVRAVNPYTKVPLSQASFPVYVNVINSTSDVQVAFPLLVEIRDPQGNLVYSQRVAVNNLEEGADTTVAFPNWDASNQGAFPGGEYTVNASLDQPGYDSYEDDNQTYSKFYLNVESGPNAIQEFAWDGAGLSPQPGIGNDIPKLTGIPGSGIGFNGMTGEVAMNFYIAWLDSIYGVRVYFGSANQSPDPIEITLLDNISAQPLATLKAARGAQGLDRFSSYYFTHPIALGGGVTYTIEVKQLSTNNMQLGGDVSRGGARLFQAGRFPDMASVFASASGRAFGTQWGSGASDNSGDISNAWAFSTFVNSLWVSTMTPRYNLWPAMNPSDSIQPLLSFVDSIPFTGAGTYAPMIRPMFSAPAPSDVQSSRPGAILTLGTAYPNPFDPTSTSTTIAFTLPAQAPVSLTICNIMGDVVNRLVNSPMGAGEHSVSWDGRDEHGAVVPAGIYFVTLKSAGSHTTAKLIVAH